VAISYVDKDSQDSAGAQSLTFTIPAGATTDDFMVAFVKQSENTGAQIWDDDGGGGNGWTREAYNRTTGGRDQETAIFWKVHDGSESDPTFTWDSGGTNEPMSGTLAVYRGVDIVTPFSDLAWEGSQNDANPPNPAVDIEFAGSWVVCFHAATHDDISTVAAPTGYSLRAQVWSGTSNDHRNHFVADSNGTTLSAGSYTPPDWQHSVLNNTPEYHTYSLVLNELDPIHITGGTGIAAFDWTDTNLTVTGDGFEATQNIGKVEYWDDEAGTTKSAVTIDSWSDTSIQFDPVQGSLGNNTAVFLVVTNLLGDVSRKVRVAVGIPSYFDAIKVINPDHLWELGASLNYNDTGTAFPVRHITSGVVGTQGYPATPICEDTTHAMLFDDVLNRREILDSASMNITISSTERTVAGWVQLGGIQQSVGAIWKEGGGVQNLAFLTGLGNVLMAQLADTAGTRDNVQAVCEFRLTADRPYHICLRYTHVETTKEMRLFVDGVEQPDALTDGNPMTLGTFDSHSGDVTWGDPDNNLETGGTDIAYTGQEDCLYSGWCTWSDNSAQTGALNKTTEIRDILFRRGAIPKYTIASDTESEMQSDLDTQLTDTEVEDWPLGIRIESPTGGGNIELTAKGITFSARTTEQLEWRGPGILTWIVDPTSELDESKIFSTGGGNITVKRISLFTIEGVVNGAEVRIYDDELVDPTNFDTELAGIEANVGTTFEYAHYGSSNDVIIQMIADGYKETKVSFTLGNANETLILIPIVDENI
jgi:hypothetical protein